jgi:hypothetical protein
MTSGFGQDGGAAVQLGIVLKPELTGTAKAEARSSASSRRNGRPLCPARHGTLVCAATPCGQEGSLQLQARALTLIRRKGVPVRSRRLRSKYVCVQRDHIMLVRVTQRFAQICAARGLGLPFGNTEKLSDCARLAVARSLWRRLPSVMACKSIATLIASSHPAMSPAALRASRRQRHTRSRSPSAPD